MIPERVADNNMTKPRRIPDGWPALIPGIVVDQPESLVNLMGESILMIGGATDRAPTNAFPCMSATRTSPTAVGRQRGDFHRGAPEYAIRRSPSNGSGSLGQYLTNRDP